MSPSGIDLLRRAPHQVIKAVAIDALTLGIGGTLPPGSTYQSRLGAGSGTVQSALAQLKAVGALNLVSHGHRGREITGIDVGALWRAAELGRVVFAFPPVGPVEIRALSEGLSAQLSDMGIAHEIDHSRGAENRIQMLGKGADLALISRGAADRMPRSPSGSVCCLGGGTFYAPRQLVVVYRPGIDPNNLPDSLVIAVDQDSWDQEALTRAEFPESAQCKYVSCRFPRVPVALLKGEADVGVWHTVQTLIPIELTGLQTTPLRRPAAVKLEQRLSEAVMVLGDRPEISALFKWLDLGRIVAHQARLVRLAQEDPEALEDEYSEI